MRSVAEAKPAASLDIEGEPSRAVHGEGRVIQIHRLSQ